VDFGAKKIVELLHPGLAWVYQFLSNDSFHQIGFFIADSQTLSTFVESWLDLSLAGLSALRKLQEHLLVPPAA
jgi:hypothetical protein